MKRQVNFIRKTCISLFFILLINNSAIGQATSYENRSSDFWNRVRFGGGLGLGFGSGYTNIAVSPSAIYEFHSYFSAGLALNGSYVNDRRHSSTVPEYQSWIYGGSIVALFQPIPQLQISVEPELLRVNRTYETSNHLTLQDDFWSSGLFLGAGYRTGNVTLGVRYNVLHDSDKQVYADAFMPFVRVYF